MIKISIITVVFNNVKYIEDCIKSVLSQTYTNIEYIIIDGGSTDGTLDIINKYRDRISYFVSEEDNGIYDAMNKGIKLATGDIIGILHSDDQFYNNFIIEKIVKEFEIGKVDIVYGDIVFINGKSKVVRKWKSGVFKNNKLKYGWMIPHTSLFVKKDVYSKYGNYDVKYKIAADYDLILRILKKNISLFYLPEIIVKMRIGGKSTESISALFKKIKEDYAILKKNQVGSIFTVFIKRMIKIKQFY